MKESRPGTAHVLLSTNAPLRLLKTGWQVAFRNPRSFAIAKDEMADPARGIRIEESKRLVPVLSRAANWQQIGITAGSLVQNPELVENCHVRSGRQSELARLSPTKGSVNRRPEGYMHHGDRHRGTGTRAPQFAGGSLAQ